MIFVPPARKAAAPATDAAATLPRNPGPLAALRRRRDCCDWRVKAVTGDVTVVTRDRDPCAGRDRHRAGSDRRGRWSPAKSPGRRLGPLLLNLRSLAHETVACATAVAITLCGSSRHARFTRYPLPRCRPRRPTGAVEAVTGDLTIAVTAVTRGRDSCAGRDGHRAGRDHRGRWSPAQSPGRRPGPCLLDPLRSLAHETLACATEAAIADRSVRHESCGSRSVASLSVASLLTMTRAALRSRLPKMSQGQMCSRSRAVVLYSTE
jgi:hypothetical protein